MMHGQKHKGVADRHRPAGQKHKHALHRIRSVQGLSHAGKAVVHAGLGQAQNPYVLLNVGRHASKECSATRLTLTPSSRASLKNRRGASETKNCRTLLPPVRRILSRKSNSSVSRAVSSAESISLTFGPTIRPTVPFSKG